MSKEPKRYKIESLQDMVDCTNRDNLDAFIADLKGLLMEAHMFKEFSETVGKEKNLTEEQRMLHFTDFVWIDDGKHDITTTLSVTPKKDDEK